MEKVVRKISLHDKTNYDLQYWFSKTPEERLEAIEFLRQQFYSNAELSKGLQRVYRIIKLK